MEKKASLKGCIRAFGNTLETTTLIFAALQATGVVHWAWWQVLAPMLVKYAIWLIACVVLGLLAAAEKGKEESHAD